MIPLWLEHRCSEGRAAEQESLAQEGRLSCGRGASLRDEQGDEEERKGAPRQGSRI